MRRLVLAVLVLLLAPYAFAATFIGVVVSVDKKEITIKPERGDKLTFAFDPDMGKKHNKWVPRGHALGVTPDQIKAGMIVRVDSPGREKGVLVCKRAVVIEEYLGTREIDFSPLLVKDKDSVPPFVLRLSLSSRPSLGNYRPYNRAITYKDGLTAKELRKEIKGIKDMFQGDGWKVKAEGDYRLLIEAYKDEVINGAGAMAERCPQQAGAMRLFPNEQQPRVRWLDPRDPSKSK
jgi:hypothetical protein